MPAFLTHSPAGDESLGADVLVVPLVGATNDLHKQLTKVSRGIADAVLRAIDLGDASSKAGDICHTHARGVDRFPRILVVGMGDENPTGPAIRRTFARLAKKSLPRNADKVAIWCSPAFGTGNILRNRVASATDGLMEGAYRWTMATTERRSVGQFVFLGENARSQAKIEEGVSWGKRLGEGVLLARELGNTPANHMSPADMANRAKEMAKEKKLKATVLAGAQLTKEKLVALQTVGQASTRPPQLIVLEYTPRGTAKTAPIALVGKGLVYDTGGLNIKPGASMAEMKFDKCGACVVLGAMSAIAALELPVRVVAVIGAAENSISGDAYRPGDVIGSRSGKTIEVLNTDAEGRIVLADALDYVVTKYSPRGIVDAATLTGAAYYALGDRACALLGNHDGLIEHMHDSSLEVGEPAWQLPLWPEYLDDVKSQRADIRNTGAFGAGTIAGAAFLAAFVRDTPWAHLDIASVSRDRRDSSVGATGFGVRLIVEAVRTWPKAKSKR